MKEKKPIKKGALWRVLYPYLTTLGISVLVSFGACFVFFYKLIAEKGVDYVYDMYEDSTAINELMTMFVNFLSENSNYVQIVFGVIAIPVMLLFMHMDKKRLYRDGDYVTYEKPAPLAFIMVILLGVFSAITLNNLISISGLMEKYIDEVNSVNSLIYSGGIWIEIIAIVIIGPISEELIFRGLIYRRLREFAPMIASILVSALIFGYYHGNLVQGIYAFGIGCILAFVMERTQNVWACVFLHVGANGFSVLISESGVGQLLNNNTIALTYIVVGALGLIFTLWYVYEKVNPEVLIPSSNETKQQEAEE